MEYFFVRFFNDKKDNVQIYVKIMEHCTRNLFFIFIFAVFCFIGYACQLVCKENNTQAEDIAPNETDIGDILKFPKEFTGRKIIIKGEFLGWTSGVNSPMVTRSDWAVKDDTGIIYVTGKSPGGLDYYRDVGHTIRILGIVRIARNSMAYIEALSVTILK